jgi:hypothetical protein
VIGEHINKNGEFQSDKYPWCEPGFVPLKLTDPMARDLLYQYARRRASVDADFSADLRTALKSAGYPATLVDMSEHNLTGI